MGLKLFKRKTPGCVASIVQAVTAGDTGLLAVELLSDGALIPGRIHAAIEGIQGALQARVLLCVMQREIKDTDVVLLRAALWSPTPLDLLAFAQASGLPVKDILWAGSVLTQEYEKAATDNQVQAVQTGFDFVGLGIAPIDPGLYLTAMLSYTRSLANSGGTQPDVQGALTLYPLAGGVGGDDRLSFRP